MGVGEGTNGVAEGVAVDGAATAVTVAVLVAGAGTVAVGVTTGEGVGEGTAVDVAFGEVVLRGNDIIVPVAAGGGAVVGVGGSAGTTL